MSYATPQGIKRSYEKAKDNRANFDIEWQKVADEGIGRRQFTVKNITKGLQRYGHIVDSTMRSSHQMLTGGLMGLLANPETAWLDLRPPDDLIGQPEVDDWFREATRKTLRSFQRPEARWASSFSESLSDGTGFGTGALMTMADEMIGPYFMARPLPEIYIAEDERGNIDTVYREFKYTARQCQMAFARSPMRGPMGTTSSEVVNKAMEKEPEKEFQVLQLIHHMADPAAHLGNIDLLGKAWRSVYMMLDPAEQLAEGGFHENPINVWRWGKEAGELYGIGPGWIALPDTMMLNRMKETTLRMGQKAAEPPLLVPDDGLLTQLNGSPNSINVVRRDLLTRSGGPLIQPLPMGTNMPITREIMNDTRDSVRQVFFANLLQLFNDPRMTATQVLELSAEAQRLMAPMLSRIKSELLDPTVNRVFQINLRQGRLGPMPQVLEGREFKVEYTSPVLRSQRQPEAQTALQIWAAAGQIGQIDPSVFDNLDADESIRIIHDALGGAPTMLRSQQDVEEIRKAQAEMAKQQQALQQAEQMSMIAKNAPPEMLQAGLGG